MLLRASPGTIARSDRPPHRNLCHVVGGTSFEAELRQRTRDVDQAILNCVFELGIVAAHDAAADTANERRHRAQKFAQRRGIAAQRRARTVVERRVLRGDLRFLAVSALEHFERRCPAGAKH
jgi:hypothetical protein